MWGSDHTLILNELEARWLKQNQTEVKITHWDQLLRDDPLTTDLRPVDVIAT